MDIRNGRNVTSAKFFMCVIRQSRLVSWLIGSVVGIRYGDCNRFIKIHTAHSKLEKGKVNKVLRKKQQICNGHRSREEWSNEWMNDTNKATIKTSMFILRCKLLAFVCFSLPYHFASLCIIFNIAVVDLALLHFTSQSTSIGDATVAAFWSFYQWQRVRLSIN